MQQPRQRCSKVLIRASLMVLSGMRAGWIGVGRRASLSSGALSLHAGVGKAVTVWRTLCGEMD